MPPLRPEGTEGVAELGADGRPGAPAPRELHGRNLSEVGDAGGHPRGSSVPSQPRALGRNPFGIGDGVISKSHRGAIRKHRFAGEGEHGVAPFGLGGLGGIHQQVERGSQGASRQQAACRKRHQVAAVQGGCAAGWSGSSGSMRGGRATGVGSARVLQEGRSGHLGRHFSGSAGGGGRGSRSPIRWRAFGGNRRAGLPGAGDGRWRRRPEGCLRP